MGRISVVATGPIFNFILAFLLSVIITGFVGYDPAEIMEVERALLRQKPGFGKEMLLQEFDGYTIDVARDLYVYSYLNELQEEPVTMKVRRNGGKKNIYLYRMCRFAIFWASIVLIQIPWRFFL